MTDVSPETTAITIWNYDLCAQYPNVALSKICLEFDCYACRTKSPLRDAHDAMRPLHPQNRKYWTTVPHTAYLCAQHSGTVPDAVDVYLECDSAVPPRRYLVIQRSGTNYLTFCELEVYLRRKSSRPLFRSTVGRPFGVVSASFVARTKERERERGL